MSDLVPFGKYKGQPIEDMLADANYMAWLEAQPWFRERFAHLVKHRDADAMSRTPVHNRLQALFLDDGYCRAFIHVGADERAAKYRWFAEQEKTSTVTYLLEAASEIKKWGGGHALHVERLAAEIQAAPILYRCVPTFERDNADVHIMLLAKIPSWSDTKTGLPSSAAYADTHEKELGALRVEIKPTVADEYPAVLRQMERNRSEFLFVDAYQGEGATERQFVQIFAASGKLVVFKRDVDAALARRVSP
jgi:hypothetical protein